MAIFPSKWGLAQWGEAQWANIENVSTIVKSTSAAILGQGQLVNTPGICVRDMLFIKSNMPRSTVAVRMPVAFITKINVPSEKPLCSPTTTTIPATGAFNTFVEVSSDPQNNP